jgi:hypothetical protein
MTGSYTAGSAHFAIWRQQIAPWRLGHSIRKMSESGRDPKIIDALFYLTQPEQFEISHQALSELREEGNRET